MKGQQLTHEQRKDIVSQYLSGVPIARIAARFNVAKSTPGQLARKAGAPLRSSHINRSLMARAAEWRWRRGQ